MSHKATLILIYLFIGNVISKPLLESNSTIDSENKLSPLKSLAQKQAGSTVFSYIRNILDQAETTFNSALDTARESPAIQRVTSRVKEIRKQLGANLLAKS